MNSILHKLESSLKRVIKWYATPSGVLFFLGLLGAVVLMAVDEDRWALGLLLTLAAVVVPYKLMWFEQERREARRNLRSLADSLAATERRLSSAQQQTESVRDATDRRLSSAQERTESVHHAAHSRIDRVKASMIDHADAKSGEALRKALAVESSLHEVRKDLLGSIDVVRTETASLLRSERLTWQQAGADAVTVADGLEHRLRSLVEVERRERVFALANRDAASRPLKRVIVVACIQRVGSTWAFDLLRHHPDIDMHPTADLYRALGVSGRRYPTHLTDVERRGVFVEVQQGVGGIVPDIGTGPVPGASDFSVEKVHPSAIAFDADDFAENVRRLRSQLGGEETVQVVYLLREPMETVRSFISYRRRVPTWHKDVPEDSAADFCARSLEVLERMHELLPGSILSFESLSREPATCLAILLQRLDVVERIEDAHDDALSAVNATAKGQRPETAFFSTGNDKPTVNEIELGLLSADPSRASASLRLCREIHNRMLKSSDYIRVNDAG